MMRTNFFIALSHWSWNLQFHDDRSVFLL